MGIHFCDDERFRAHLVALFKQHKVLRRHPDQRVANPGPQDRGQLLGRRLLGQLRPVEPVAQEPSNSLPLAGRAAPAEPLNEPVPGQRDDTFGRSPVDHIVVVRLAHLARVDRRSQHAFRGGIDASTCLSRASASVSRRRGPLFNFCGYRRFAKRDESFSAVGGDHRGVCHSGGVCRRKLQPAFS